MKLKQRKKAGSIISGNTAVQMLKINQHTKRGTDKFNLNSMRISASRIIKMKISSLLLIISLMTGCEARTEVKECRERWVKLTCEYSGKDGVFTPKQIHIQEKKICQPTFTQTAYRTAETTIKCDNSANQHRAGVKFLCKENKTNRRFSLTETSSGISMSISNVSSHDAGVYWCIVETEEGKEAALRKIELKVKDITSFTRSATTGQNFTYWCKYPNGSPIKKFICKGEDPSICEPLVNNLENTNTRFSMKENKTERNISITVRDVTADDAGTYWCGAQSTDGKHSNPFYHRFTMTVVPAPTPVIPGDNSSTQDVELSRFAIPVIVCAAVLLLLIIIIITIISIYKRCSHSENTGSAAAAQPIREDYIYEEIQETVQKPDSTYTVNSTIYSTVSSPPDPSASLHYCTIKFKSSSEQTGGEAPTVKSRSACEYSTVKYSQPHATYATVNPPSRSSQELLHSKVNKPQ